MLMGASLPAMFICIGQVIGLGTAIMRTAVVGRAMVLQAGGGGGTMLLPVAGLLADSVLADSLLLPRVAVLGRGS